MSKKITLTAHKMTPKLAEYVEIFGHRPSPETFKFRTPAEIEEMAKVALMRGKPIKDWETRPWRKTGTIIDSLYSANESQNPDLNKAKRRAVAIQEQQELSKARKRSKKNGIKTVKSKQNILKSESSGQSVTATNGVHAIHNTKAMQLKWKRPPKGNLRYKYANILVSLFKTFIKASHSYGYDLYSKLVSALASLFMRITKTKSSIFEALILLVGGCLVLFILGAQLYNGDYHLLRGLTYVLFGFPLLIGGISIICIFINWFIEEYSKAIKIVIETLIVCALLFASIIILALFVAMLGSSMRGGSGQYSDTPYEDMYRIR